MSAVVLIQSSLLRQISIVAPQTAPALIFTQIPADRVAAFDAEVAHGYACTPDNNTYLRAPFVTGRITAVRGQPVIKDKLGHSNDISLSALGSEPPNAGVVEGKRQAADYAGPPLLAIASLLAGIGGLLAAFQALSKRPAPALRSE